MTSVEQKTLVRCTSILTTAFESDPISIANDLHSHSFIPAAVKNEVVDTNQANSYKASKLVSCVSSQIASSPPRRVTERFKAFVQVLEVHPWLDGAVDEVIHKYKENGGNYERIARHHQVSSGDHGNRSSSPKVSSTAVQPRPWKGLTCPVDEQSLSHELRNVTGGKVHRLGIKLKVPHSKITEFETNFPRDNERVKTEIFKYWLDNAEECSWKVIADALVAIDLKNMARHISGDKGYDRSSVVDEAVHIVNKYQSGDIRYRRPVREPITTTTESNETEEEIPQLVPISPDPIPHPAHLSQGAINGNRTGPGRVSSTFTYTVLLVLLIFVALITYTYIF